MSENKKAELYKSLYAQTEELLKNCNNEIARMASVLAVLYHNTDYFFWCGFYRLIDGELIVGPYQGPPACQVLKINTGVCWESIKQKETIIVPDVSKFPGHIACDPRSKSEIVIPFKNKSGEISGVFDADSKHLNAFDETDAKYLQSIISLI